VDYRRRRNVFQFVHGRRRFRAPIPGFGCLLGAGQRLQRAGRTVPTRDLWLRNVDWFSRKSLSFSVSVHELRSHVATVRFPTEKAAFRPCCTERLSTSPYCRSQHRIFLVAVTAIDASLGDAPKNTGRLSRSRENRATLDLGLAALRFARAGRILSTPPAGRGAALLRFGLPGVRRLCYFCGAELRWVQSRSITCRFARSVGLCAAAVVVEDCFKDQCETDKETGTFRKIRAKHLPAFRYLRCLAKLRKTASGRSSEALAKAAGVKPTHAHRSHYFGHLGRAGWDDDGGTACRSFPTFRANCSRRFSSSAWGNLV